MSGRRTLLVLAGAGLVVASAIAVPLWAQRDTSEAAGEAPPPHQGRFIVDCDYSHSLPDDPIVYPRAPGASHLHDFFGATEANAFTRAETLVEGDTTCETQQDTAGYWAPALLDGEGRPIEPIGSDAYYRAGPGVDPQDVEPFPFGLTIIGGDASATEAQDTAVVGWSCGPNPLRHTTPPPCQEGNPLILRVTFPDCWNGEDLTSPDHLSHMARSGPDGCPDEHPVAVPQLEFVVEYPVYGADAAELYLASGSIETAHADFYNAWEPEKLADEVRYCINADVVCGSPSLTGEGVPQPSSSGIP
jgi:hypothetical protein